MFHSGDAVPPTSDQSLFLITFQISAFIRDVLIGLAFQAYVASVFARSIPCVCAAANFFPRSSATRFRSAVIRLLQASINEGKLDCESAATAMSVCG